MFDGLHPTIPDVDLLKLNDICGTDRHSPTVADLCFPPLCLCPVEGKAPEDKTLEEVMVQ